MTASLLAVIFMSVFALAVGIYAVMTNEKPNE